MKKNIGYSIVLGLVFFVGVAFILLRNRHQAEPVHSAPLQEQIDKFPDTSPSKTNVAPVYQEKVNQLKASVEKNPSNIAHIASLARLFMDGHQNSEAIKYFEKALSLQPKNDSLLFDLSVCYFNEKQYDKAMEITERVLRFKKDHPKGLYNKAMILATEGKTVEAEKILNHLVTVAPQSDEAGQAKAHFLSAGKQ